jgi:hypothetical protein
MSRPNPPGHLAPPCGSASPPTGRSPARGPSAQLILDAVVASYIHEISERHAPACTPGRGRQSAGDGQLE